MKWDMWRDMLK